ncbi:MAG: flagellar biosynthetic protein FliO [Clostridiaceae bacterium]|nr:flagellar biosynthetic protein FliO [Clostridiaceae bacterium]
MNSSSSIYGILYFLFMSAVILAAAYFVTKYLSRKSFNQGKNKNLKIVETAALGIDKSLLLVKVGEQYVLLGSTQKNISLLAVIEPEKLTIGNTSEAYSNLDDESFESYMNNLQAENGRTGMNTINNNLKKLKSIVRGNKTDV